ncbi:metal-dependent protein hydrolase [Umbelopsis sp. PMI_123]|nr:metal-dependent protein hydrolase [Umbelopsis sp. PMI_123]
MAAKMVRKLIGTHSGHFHCDEALAVYMLRQTSLFKDAGLVRSRDPTKLAEADVVVDVGGVYDSDAHKYDHHQRGFFETFDDKHKTKLSSAGLVYKHFGRNVIASLLEIDEKDPKIDVLYPKIYDDFIEALDGNDNGISQYPSDLEPAYKESTSLPSRVGAFNPWWNQSVTEADVDARFEQASQLAGSELRDKLLYTANAWLPARELVKSAFEKRSDVHPNGRVIALERSCPWKEHLLELEREQGLNSESNILFVLYPDESNNWRIQCVPIKPEGFENRKSLPEVWRGHRDAALSEISRIPDCIFVHAAGFIGGNKTRHGATEMARLALEM